jgi:hypothetical protein
MRLRTFEIHGRGVVRLHCNFSVDEGFCFRIIIMVIIDLALLHSWLAPDCTAILASTKGSAPNEVHSDAENSHPNSASPDKVEGVASFVPFNNTSHAAMGVASRCGH